MSMLRAVLTTFIVLLSSILLLAQDDMTVSGKVVNENQKPIAYATFTLYSSSDSSMVDGISTDSTGQFALQVEQGDYYGEVSFLSYKKKTISNIPGNKSEIDLGTIQLQPKSENIDEVVVEEEKSQTELKLDKKVFNVGKDLSTSGGNASDVLDRVPSVNVDVEGNISLRGSGNVRILINGKPSGLVASGDPQSLRRLQSNLIERVEVITNPSAKYSAEGEVGIINIILKEQDKGGLNGSFDVNTAYPHDHGAAANLNYRKDWLNFFISEGVNWERNPGGGETVQEYFYPDTSYSYKRDIDQTRGGISNNLRLGVDMYVTPTDIITLSGLYQYSRDIAESTITYEDYNDMDEKVQTVTRKQDEVAKGHEAEFDLSYEKKFATEDRKLTADVKYSLEDEIEEADYTQNNNTIGNGINRKERSSNVEYEETWLFQADYVHPFSEEGKLETGIKANLRDFENDYTVEVQQNGDQWETLPRYDNEFIYVENIYGGYVTAKEKWGNFSAKGGLRSEYANIRTELTETNETNPRDYIDFFPSGFLSYKIKKRNTIQASYSRRISRPDFWDLVPFFQYADSRNYRSGNPDLEPEYTHSVELGYQRVLDNGNLLANAYYRYRTNVFEDITFVEDSTGLTRSKPVNLATEDVYGVELSGTYNFTDWWRANGSINGYRSIQEGSYQGEDLFSDTYTWQAKLSTKFTIAQLVDVQSSLDYRAPRKTTQGRRKFSYAVDLAASMQVLRDRGKITLSVEDIFDTRRRRWVREGDNFRTEGHFQWHTSQQVRLSFNYRLKNNKKDPEERLMDDQ